jgi:hypothetical protein
VGVQWYPRKVMSLRVAAAVVGAVLVGVAPRVQADDQRHRQPVSAADAIVEQFERHFAIAVLDEDCRQRVFRVPEGFGFKTGPYALPPPQSTVRHIRSELLLVWRGADGWLARRRLLSIDGTTVAATSATPFDVLGSGGVDRLLERAVALPEPTPLLRIGAAVSVFDLPFWPAALLDPSERSRLGFTMGHVSASGGRIRANGTHGDVDLQSSFTLDGYGRVARAEAVVSFPTAVTQLTVEFENNRRLQLVVPRKMSERYRHGLETVTSEIVYSNLRRFERSGQPIVALR